MVADTYSLNTWEMEGDGQKFWGQTLRQWGLHETCALKTKHNQKRKKEKYQNKPPSISTAYKMDDIIFLDEHVQSQLQ